MSGITKAKRGRRKLERVAHHEAGHAVLAEHFRMKFHHVTIEPNDDSLGQVLHAKMGTRFRPDIDITPKVRDTLEKMILVDLAGMAADSKFIGRKSKAGGGEDTHQAVGLACRLFPDEVVGSYIKFSTGWVEVLVGSPRIWRQIEAVAAALMESRTLTGVQVREICRIAILGPELAKLTIL